MVRVSSSGRKNRSVIDKVSRSEFSETAVTSSLRDVSVSRIIALSVKAGQMKTATVLLRAIRSEETQAELVANHPPLIVLLT